MGELCNEICTNVLGQHQNSLAETLDFDSILSSIPYINILETELGGKRVDVVCKDVPIVTKKMEESFMRECVMVGERKCVMDNDCECMFIDPQIPFVATEFLLPGQTVHNCKPQMCVLCTRKHTQKLYYDVIYRQPNAYIGLIQRYGVVCDAEGEYNRNYVLIMPPSGPVHAMPYPSPVHSRNNYTVEVRSTIRTVKPRQETNF